MRMLNVYGDKVKLLIVSLLFFTFIFSSRLVAFDEAKNRESLRGVKAIAVVIRIENQGERYGLTEHEVQQDIELKLRMAGIEVLDKSEVATKPYLPGLVFIITPYDRQDSNGIIAFHMSLAVEQPVSLIRDNSVTLYAETWETGYVGMVGQTNFRNLRDDIKNLTDNFVNAYLSVNLKKEQP